MSPRVSICIPAYRQPTFVVRAVASVFAQSFQDFEIVVTDDSETMEVQEALSQWRDDARLVYQHNESRLGSPENWNAAMKIARSDLIKFLHHDDWFADDDALKHYVEIMEAEPRIDFAFSAANACEDDGRLIFVHRPQAEQIEMLRLRPWALQFGNFIGAPSATIFRRRPSFKFDGTLSWVVDMEGYLRLLGPSPRFAFISEPLVSVTANGAHQVTRVFSSDRVSRVIEHLRLYTIQRPPRGVGRIEGTMFVGRLLRECGRGDLAAIAARRSRQERTLEERLALGAMRLGLLVNRGLVAIRTKVREGAVRR